MKQGLKYDEPDFMRFRHVLHLGLAVISLSLKSRSQALSSVQDLLPGDHTALVGDLPSRMKTGELCDVDLVRLIILLLRSENSSLCNVVVSALKGTAFS